VSGKKGNLGVTYYPGKPYYEVTKKGEDLKKAIRGKGKKR